MKHGINILRFLKNCFSLNKYFNKNGNMINKDNVRFGRLLKINIKLIPISKNAVLLSSSIPFNEK